MDLNPVLKQAKQSQHRRIFVWSTNWGFVPIRRLILNLIYPWFPWGNGGLWERKLSLWKAPANHLIVTAQTLTCHATYHPISPQRMRYMQSRYSRDARLKCKHTNAFFCFTCNTIHQNGVFWEIILWLTPGGKRFLKGFVGRCVRRWLGLSSNLPQDCAMMQSRRHWRSCAFKLTSLEYL